MNGRSSNRTKARRPASNRSIHKRPLIIGPNRVPCSSRKRLAAASQSAINGQFVRIGLAEPHRQSANTPSRPPQRFARRAGGGNFGLPCLAIARPVGYLEGLGRLCAAGSARRKTIIVYRYGPSMAEKQPKRQAKRILLVDDDHEIVESMRLALEAKGYEILIARDGNQGLAMAEREDPDLVILDMMMPKRSGFLVLEKIRRTRPVPLRVIMITANEGSRHKAYAEMLGVDDYIRKPFGMDRLLDSVDRLLA
jgi:CheY-like chemotaxis protein